MRLASEVLQDLNLEFKDGYLANLDDWSEDLCVRMAADNGITLTESHWCIINAARDYHRETTLSPAMRPLIKALRQIEPEAASTRLHDLFGEKPAIMISTLAGLPKPVRCL